MKGLNIHYSAIKCQKGVEERIISAKRYQSCYLTVCGRELAQKTRIFKRNKCISEDVLLSPEGVTLLKELQLIV